MPEPGQPQSPGEEHRSVQPARSAGLGNVIIAIILAVLGLVLLAGFFGPNRGTALVVSAAVLAGFAWLTITVVRGVAALAPQSRLRVAYLATGVLVLIVAAPFVVPFFPGLAGDLIKYGSAAVVFVTVLLIARRLTAGLAIGASIFAIIVATWVVGLLTLYTYDTAWRGLDIRDVSGFDQGDGFEIGLGIFSLTAMSPFLGFLIGLLSQIGKRSAALVAP